MIKRYYDAAIEGYQLAMSLNTAPRTDFAVLGGKTK
jgi:hypothetical protein